MSMAWSTECRELRNLGTNCSRAGKPARAIDWFLWKETHTDAVHALLHSCSGPSSTWIPEHLTSVRTQVVLEVKDVDTYLLRPVRVDRSTQVALKQVRISCALSRPTLELAADSSDLTLWTLCPAQMAPRLVRTGMGIHSEPDLESPPRHIWTASIPHPHTPGDSLPRCSPRDCSSLI